MRAWTASQSVSSSQRRDSHSKNKVSLKKKKKKKKKTKETRSPEKQIHKVVLWPLSCSNLYLSEKLVKTQAALKGGETLHPEGKVCKLRKDTNQKLQEVSGN